MIPREVIRNRECAREGCGVLYKTPHGGLWPARFCSLECYKTPRTPAPPKRRAQMPRTTGVKKRKAISPASPAQRQVVKDRACIVCAQGAGYCHPSHVIDRAMLTEGQEHPLAVVSLCPQCHRAYDEGELSLLEHLEPHHRDVLAYAVSRFGLLRTLQRVTNTHWRPVDEREAA